MKKNWKKVLSLLLAVAMVFTMNTAVFADETGSASDNAASEAVSSDASSTQAAAKEETTVLTAPEAGKAGDAQTDAVTWTAAGSAWKMIDKDKHTPANSTVSIDSAGNISVNSVSEGDILVYSGTAAFAHTIYFNGVAAASISNNTTYSMNVTTDGSGQYTWENQSVEVAGNTVTRIEAGATIDGSGTVYNCPTVELNYDYANCTVDFGAYTQYAEDGASLDDVSEYIYPGGPNDGENYIVYGTTFGYVKIPGRVTWSGGSEELENGTAEATQISFNGTEDRYYYLTYNDQDGAPQQTATISGGSAGKVVSFNGLTPDTAYTVWGYQAASANKFRSADCTIDNLANGGIVTTAPRSSATSAVLTSATVYYGEADETIKNNLTFKVDGTTVAKKLIKC